MKIINLIWLMFFMCRSLQVLFSDWVNRTTRICATTYHKLTDRPTRSWLTVPML